MTRISCPDVITNCTWILKKTGLYPTKVSTHSYILKQLLNFIIHFVTYTVLVSNVVVAIVTRNGTLLNWQASVLMPVTNYYLKAAVLIINRKNVYLILADLNSKEFNLHSKKSNKYIQDSLNMSHMLLKYFALSSAVLLLTFGVSPFLTDGFMLVPASFNTGRYDVYYKILHLFATGYITCNYISIETLYMTLLRLSAAELKILQEKIIYLLEDVEEYCKGPNNLISIDNVDSVIQYFLKECVILHDKINL